MKHPKTHIGNRRTAGRCILAYTLAFMLMAGAVCLYFGLNAYIK